MLALLYQLNQAHFVLVEKPFDAHSGTHFLTQDHSLITDADEPTLTAALHKLRLDAVRLSAIPTVASHTVTAPRVAFHACLAGGRKRKEAGGDRPSTLAGIPFTHMSTQKIRPPRLTSTASTTSLSSPRWAAPRQPISSMACPCGPIPCQLAEDRTDAEPRQNR